MKNLVYLLFFVLAIVACDTEEEPIPEANEFVPIVLRAELEQRVSQDNEFALNLLKNVVENTDEQNVFISPLSVSIALGMVWNGADGDTKTEIESVLKMSGLTADDINDYYKVMQTTLPQIDALTNLSIANSIWYRNEFEVKQNFLDVNANYFDAYIKELDFGQAWAVDTINNWCEKKTNDLIKDPLDEIPADAMMYLVNAIYFKGMWVKKFDAENTFETQFTNEEDQQVAVNMMQQTDTFAYVENNYAQFVDLPYGNTAFSMTVILPKDGKTTDDVLDSLDVETWNQILTGMTKQTVVLYLPRFKNENKFELKDVLINMGMPSAFSDTADFSKISDISLCISRVIHNTYVEVNEEGTEAAAVTIVEIVETSMPVYPIFRADKPFIFAIREKSTGVILFIGKMGDVHKY